FTDYFFAENDVVKFNFNVYEDEAKNNLIKSNSFQTDINVKANYLTTIKGNILTDGKGFTVTVVDGFENIDNNGNNTDPDYDVNVITSGVELLRALENGGNFVLGSDINLSSGDFAAYEASKTRSTAGKTTTINLNGFTITFEDGAKVEVPENNTLIIKDESENQEGKIETGNDAGIENKGNVTIEGGNIDEGAIENNGGDVEIKGGILEEGAVDNNSGNVIITGNNINDNVVEGDVTNYYAGLVQAFADGGEYTLGANIALEQPLALAQGKVLKLTINEGVVLSIVDTSTNKNFELIKNQGTLTIEGEGKITVEATNNRGWNNYSAVIANTVGGTLTVKGVTLEHLGGTDMAYGIDNLTNGKGTSAVATINEGAIVKSTYRAIRQFLNGVEANNSLTVNAGAVVEGNNKSIWMQDPNANANTGTLVVNEGATLNGDVYLYVCAGSTEWPVSVSIAASAVNGEVLTGNVPEGYNVVEENGVWTVVSDVAKIGEVCYTSLAKAVEAAQNGDTVLFIADVEQEDGVIITDKNITIDLNGNTFTVSNGASTNNRNFKVNGSSVVTIKNGTMVAAGNYSSGAYGTLRTEGTANVTLEGVKLYNYRGNGLNVKALSGTTVTINDTEIYSQYGGGIEAAGGIIELTNVKVEQKGMYTAPYNSMAISVNGGGTVTVNSGTYSTECITAEEANNQGTSHGPWCAGVLNSGGTLIIKGGTFSNDNFGENTLATYARGLLLADTGANIQIQGGTFNAVKAIIDMTNNLGDASRNPSATISGGVFSADPRISGLYASDLISIADGYKVVEENGVWTVVRKPVVAKIGEVGYTSLAEAVAAVNDGGTITLVADEVFTENNYYDNGGWKDGLGYSGDKSFTIDLNSKTIRQDGALDDYLIWIKNDGSKANTITLKNGTLDAGTTAYCAFATASSNKQKITINFENINLVGNNPNGAVAKIRGGSELNVNAGTVITGKNNYVGIEAVGNNTVVNIYDNVNIYQNGTGSNVGGILGASYNATMNIYGGYGKSAKCGIIVMSTGATINVSGGEWIANNDGTFATGNNAVLVSQNNRYESGWACKSILNVTGGTFKGGYDCWGSGPGVEPDDAQINIKGGNFNSTPANYVVAGYMGVEENGIWTVGKSQALADFEAAIAKGGEVTLAADITLLESVVIEGKKVVLDLNGKTVTAPLFSAFEVKSGAELTIKNGKVVAYESTVRAIGGKAIIESGEYTSTGTAADSPSTYRYSLDCREGGELVVNGGTFKSNNGMINVGSTVTINGGKFENVVEKGITRHFAYVSAPITINDGEFYGAANSSAGGCFFCGAAAGCDIQINGGKFISLWTSGSVNRIFEYYYGGTINVTGGMFNTNGGIATFVTENTDEATKAAYPYVAK
ncbi:MAG: hypothetical protein IKB15_01470, partial [Alistipes sp.]|nr:hypothetical protein [Alistipes sp.]